MLCQNDENVEKVECDNESSGMDHGPHDWCLKYLERGVGLAWEKKIRKSAECSSPTT